MAQIDTAGPGPAYLFSRRLEEALRKEEGHEDDLIWVLIDDDGPRLAMLAPMSWFWRQGTVVLIGNEQWTRLNDGRWANTQGEFVTHDELMEKASKIDPQWRRVVLWHAC